MTVPHLLMRAEQHHMLQHDQIRLHDYQMSCSNRLVLASPLLREPASLLYAVASTHLLLRQTVPSLIGLSAVHSPVQPTRRSMQYQGQRKDP